MPDLIVSKPSSCQGLYNRRPQHISRKKSKESVRAFSVRSILCTLCRIQSVFWVYFVTAWCSEERGYAWHNKSSIRPSVCLSVTLVFTDHIVLIFFENNYTKISIGSSVPGGNEVPICFKGNYFEIPSGIRLTTSGKRGFLATARLSCLHCCKQMKVKH